MKRQPCPFKQADVARAVKGARAAGIDVKKVVVRPDGRITITASRHDAQTSPKERNEWDELIADPPQADPHHG
jgi:hypothetical protein